MPTLAMRLSPSGKRIYRAVFGAVMNAAHAHQGEPVEHLAASIAKRATGTLLAQWAGVLAATRSKPVQPSISLHQRVVRSDGGASGEGVDRKSQRPPDWQGRPLASVLKRRIGDMAGQARKDGNSEREKAFVEVLRMISDHESDKEKRT